MTYKIHFYFDDFYNDDNFKYDDDANDEYVDNGDDNHEYVDDDDNVEYVDDDDNVEYVYKQMMIMTNTLIMVIMLMTFTNR